MPDSGAFDGAHVLVLVNMAIPQRAQRASLTVGTGNSAFEVEAAAAGTGGNAITLTIVDPAGNNAPLTVDVAGSAITVNLATNATSVATSTASQVVQAINNDPDANDLVAASLTTTSNGSGLVAAQASTPLAGGAAATNPAPDFQAVAAQTGYSDETSREALDASVKGTDHSQSAYGRQESSATLDALWSYKDNTQQRLREALRDREEIVLRMVIKAAAFPDLNATDQRYDAPALISSVSREASDNEVSTFSAEFNLNADFELAE